MIFSAPVAWHWLHLVIRTGRILFSKNRACSAVIGTRATGRAAGLGAEAALPGQAGLRHRPEAARPGPGLAELGDLAILRDGQRPVAIGVEPLEDRLQVREGLLRGARRS